MQNAVPYEKHSKRKHIYRTSHSNCVVGGGTLLPPVHQSLFLCSSRVYRVGVVWPLVKCLGCARRLVVICAESSISSLTSNISPEGSHSSTDVLWPHLCTRDIIIIATTTCIVPCLCSRWYDSFFCCTACYRRGTSAVVCFAW